MKKLDKRVARRKFIEGETIRLVPSNCAYFMLYIEISKSSGRSFDQLVNEFEYYNCNTEMGKYTHFYY